MHFVNFLKALDELLYEIMSWLVFYPITLWRVLRHPAQMMDYADDEQSHDRAARYSATLSPPTFLLVTMLLGHALELALVGENSLIENTSGLAGLISDGTSLILFRLAAFSVIPVVIAARLVRRRGKGLNRQTLEAPFYAQCYTAAPFALAVGLATIVAQEPWARAPLVAAAILAGALLWFFVVQVGWFARHLNESRWRALVDALIGLAECLTLVGVLVFVVGRSLA